MTRTIAILSTLDTKGEETTFLIEELKRLGAKELVLDIGVVGAPAFAPEVTREAIARAGGTSLEKLLENPDREVAAPVMVAAAARGPSSQSPAPPRARAGRGRALEARRSR